MKKFLFPLFIVLCISALIFSACSQTVKNEATEPENEMEEVVIEEEPMPDEMEPDTEMEDNDAQMEALITEKIEDCHILNFILSQNKTRDEWSTTIDRMIQKGAKINAEEKEQIIEWLVSRND